MLQQARKLCVSVVLEWRRVVRREVEERHAEEERQRYAYIRTCSEKTHVAQAMSMTLSWPLRKLCRTLRTLRKLCP
jgi:hypothetical protein